MNLFNEVATTAFKAACCRIGVTVVKKDGSEVIGLFDQSYIEPSLGNAISLQTTSSTLRLLKEEAADIDDGDTLIIEDMSYCVDHTESAARVCVDLILIQQGESNGRHYT